MLKDRMFWGSWLFILGSSLFVLEALGAMVTAFSPIALVHLAEGLLFLVGSVCFLPRTP